MFGDGVKYTLSNTTLEIRYAAFISLPVGWRRPVEDFFPGARYRIELNIITGGCYRLESADGSIHEIREGGLFMDRLMDRRLSSNGDKAPLEFIGMRFSMHDRSGEEITYQFDQPFPIVYSCPAQAFFLRQTAEAAVRFYHNGLPEAAAHCAETILYLVQAGSVIEEPLSLLKQKTHIRQIAGFMADHLGEKLRIEELAKRLGYSRAHFSKIFKQVMGASPQEYLCNLRIQQAEELLRGSAMSIEEIARATGHGSDIPFFYRLFKQRTGQCPGAYRTKCK